MKKIIIFLMLSIVSVLFAQDNVIYMDVITLKDGSIIKGIIVENKINESIKVEVGLNVFSYKYDEIKNLTKEKSLITEKTVKQPEESSVYLNQEEIDKNQVKKATLGFLNTSAGFGFRYFFSSSWKDFGVNKTWYASWDALYFKVADAVYLGLNGTFVKTSGDSELVGAPVTSELMYIPFSFRVKYAFNLSPFYATIGAGISFGYVSYDGSSSGKSLLSVSEWLPGADVVTSLGWKFMDLFLWEVEGGIHLTSKLKEYNDSMSSFFVGSKIGMYF